MVWFFLFIGSVQKYSTKFEYVNRVGFQPVIVSFPLTRTVTAGASNPSVSRKDVTTRTFLSRYLCKDGKPKICRKSPRSNSCRISFRFLWWKTVLQLKPMITIDDFPYSDCPLILNRLTVGQYDVLLFGNPESQADRIKLHTFQMWAHTHKTAN